MIYLKPRLTCFLLLLIALNGYASAATTDSEAKKGNAFFFEKHAAFLRRAEAGPVDLLFLGDSITEAWASVPDLWEEAWGPYNPANFGIRGDRTQHVIWRIEQGELDKISPRVVVLLIGTNNTGGDSAFEIVEGQKKILNMVTDALPEAKVLLLAVFPRGPRVDWRGQEDDGVARMEKIRVINQELAKVADGDRIRFLDLGPKFTEPNGEIPSEIMADQLHLTPAGYQIWVDAMLPVVNEMMAK